MDNLSLRVLQELTGFLLKEKIGSGYARDVYTLAGNPDLVIKVENSHSNFQNVAEWLFWQRWGQDKKIGPWLAPCHSISDSGSFLIMSRTEPVPKARVPKKLPTFITDVKIENLGLLNDKLVVHDYGWTNHIIPLNLRKCNI